MSNADELGPDEEPGEAAMPIRPRGALPQSVAEELLVIAVLVCFALWLFWWL